VILGLGFQLAPNSPPALTLAANSSNAPTIRIRFIIVSISDGT